MVLSSKEMNSHGSRQAQLVGNFSKALGHLEKANKARCKLVCACGNVIDSDLR